MTSRQEALVPPDLFADLRRRVADHRHEALRRRHLDQPFNTAYVDASQIDVSTVELWRNEAIGLYEELIGDPGDLAALAPCDGVDLAELDRCAAGRIRSAPIDDLRIDFEDGYGWRSNDREDDDARRAGSVADKLASAGDGPARRGLRCKPFEPDSVERAVRTIELFAAGLSEDTPSGFVVTLPKVCDTDQVELMTEVLDAIERARRWDRGSILLELQIELPAAVIARNGSVALPALIDAAEGRCVGLHYGTYDYAAHMMISPAGQSLDHPIAHFSKAIMQVVGTSHGVDVVDGSTNVVPAGELAEAAAAVREHVRLVHDGLHRGLYQGWDLHPRQLLGRWIGVTSYFLRGLGPALDRIEDLVGARSSRLLEEPASVRAIAAFLHRAVRCGVLDEDVLVRRTGLTAAQLNDDAVRLVAR